MSDVKDANEVAGKLLGHHVCFDCLGYFPKKEMEDHNPFGNIEVFICEECHKKYRENDE